VIPPGELRGRALLVKLFLGLPPFGFRERLIGFNRGGWRGNACRSKQKACSASGSSLFREKLRTLVREEGKGIHFVVDGFAYRGGKRECG